MFKKLWSKIKQLLSNIKKKCKLHWTLVIALIFNYIIPILLLSEIMVFAKDVPAGKKITFMGCIAVGSLFIIFKNKIKEWIIRMHKGFIRAILRITMAGIFWAVIYGLIIGLQYISGVAHEYWCKVGICMIISYVFYFIDEIKKRKKSITA